MSYHSSYEPYVRPSSEMPLFGFLGPISETHITNNSEYPIYASVKMTSKIDVSLNCEVGNSGKSFSSSIGKKDLTVPPGFSRVMPRQTQKFSPEGSGRRILEVCTGYLSIYVQLPGANWDCCCENHPFKENRSFTVNRDLSFVQNNYDEDFKMH